MKDKFKIKNKAFSLIEVLLAVVLVALIMIPLTQAILTSMKINNKSRCLLAGENAGILIMEYIRSQSKEDIDAFIEDDTKLFLEINKDYPVYPVATIYKGGKNNYNYSNTNSDLTAFVNNAQNKILDNQTDSEPYKQTFVYSSNDKVDAFVIGNFQSDGYLFDIVVDFTPILSGSSIDLDDESTYPEFYSYNVNVYVYWVDLDNDVNGGHTINHLISSYTGSIFNKLK